METMTVHRKLLLNCTSSTPCIDPYTSYCCVYASSPSPSPSPVADQSDPSPYHGPNHAIPYVVSAACLLGVLSLILTTCTVLLRHRFSRSRSSSSPTRDDPHHSSSVSQDRSPVDHPIWHIVTVGLPQSIIDSIASVKYKSSEGLIEESDCSVCLTGFEDGDDLRILPNCSHAFHLPCIDTWLRSHKNCPLCRSSVVSDYPPPPPSVDVNLSDSSPNSTSPIPSETALIDNPGSLDDHDIGSWHVQGAEVWKSDPEKGVLREDFEAARGSILLDNVVGTQTGEGSSQQEKGTDAEEADKEGHGIGISRLIKSSSSIGRSSAKILSSFRGGKSQSSSTLPHL